jgi:hypothetical protein
LHHCFFFPAAFFATLIEIATACLYGLPAFISVLMFFAIVGCEYPFFSGMVFSFK